MSPQTRRGRAVPASRRTRGRPDAGPHPATTDESVAEDSPLEGHLSSEGKRAKIAPVRRKKHHGTAYRWFAAYLPILLILFVLLGGVWVYVSFINPPPLSPKDQWVKIENKWSPAREKARQALADDSIDFVKQLADYKEFYTQTKGWVDDVAAVSDWGTAQNEVTSFLSDSKDYLGLLQQAYTSTTPDQVNSLSSSLPAADSTFTTEVALIRSDLDLSATGATPAPIVLPSVNATPSGSAAASGSPAASASASPSGSASPIASASPTSKSS